MQIYRPRRTDPEALLARTTAARRRRVRPRRRVVRPGADEAVYEVLREGYLRRTVQAQGLFVRGNTWGIRYNFFFFFERDP